MATSSVSSSTALDNYVAEFNGITEKLENGRDVCDLMSGFWEKLAKVELAYSKQLEELCKGRYARLETLFGQTKLMLAGGDKPSQPGALEHIGSLQDCWVKVVGEVQNLATEHETLGAHISSKVTPTITKFVKEKMKDEVAKAATGKRLLGEAKAGYQRIAATKRKYFTEVAAGKVSDGDENEPPSKAAYQAAVKDMVEKHDEVFMVGLPGVLRDVNIVEQDRAQMLCSCMNQYTRAAAALKNALTFDDTAAALEATTKDQAVTQLIMMSPPPPKPVVEDATTENKQQGQTEAQTSSLISAMSGWLTSKRTAPADGGATEEGADSETADEKESAPAKAAAATPTASEGESTSKLASFFGGWGRKKAQPAVETKVDAPGMVDSTDGTDEPKEEEKEAAAASSGGGADEPAVIDTTDGGTADAGQPAESTAGDAEAMEEDDGVAAAASVTAAMLEVTAAGEENEAEPAVGEEQAEKGELMDEGDAQ